MKMGVDWWLDGGRFLQADGRYDGAERRQWSLVCRRAPALPGAALESSGGASMLRRYDNDRNTSSMISST
jgi:hypothetical protein